MRTTLPFCPLRKKKGNQYLLSSLQCAKYFIYSISQHSHSLRSYSVCDTETPTGIWWLAQVYEAQKGWSQNANLSYLIPKSMSLPIIILLCCIDTVVHAKSSCLIPFCMRTGCMYVHAHVGCKPMRGPVEGSDCFYKLCLSFRSIPQCPLEWEPWYQRK